MELDQIEDNEFEFNWDVFDDVEEPRPDYNNSGPLDVHLYSEKTNVLNAAEYLCNQQQPNNIR